MNKLVYCPRCETHIGELVRLDNGQEWLQVGPVIVRSMHGACTCGQPFHWTVAEMMLSELIQTTLQMRSEG